MIDLHMHSCYSDDGEFTPEELVAMCAARGIDRMALTDHNCVRGVPEALAAASENGISCITGIEIDCVYRDVNFHVLGYGINIESSDFAKIENNVEEQGIQASLEMFDKTRRLGFDWLTKADMQELSKNHLRQDVWTGEMFAEALLAKPEYAGHPLLEPYRQGGLRSDNPFVNFYWDYYAQGKPCYVKLKYPFMEQIISMIQQNHGIAVLAHPGVNIKGKEHLLDGILSLGMDGIEVYSSYHTREQAQYFYHEAAVRGLKVTCGSDFHGRTKPSIYLGEYGIGAAEAIKKIVL